jgi:hypothetical protein
MSVSWRAGGKLRDHMLGFALVRILRALVTGLILLGLGSIVLVGTEIFTEAGREYVAFECDMHGRSRGLDANTIRLLHRGSDMLSPQLAQLSASDLDC